MYQELADMACERITAAIRPRLAGKRPIKGHARSLQPDRLHRSRELQHLQEPTAGRPTPEVPRQLGRPRQRLGSRVLPRGREAHPQGSAYVKNHSLGFEVPYRYGSETRKYLPDFIVLVDDGHGDGRPRCTWSSRSRATAREDAKEKKSTMDTYWVPGVNNLGSYGRWAFAEFTEVYQIEADFAGQGRRRVQR